MFDVFGLPLHPLVVHAAVVLVPLAAVGALLVMAFGRIRKQYGWLTVGFAVAAGVSALVARLSGEVLKEQLGVGQLVATHQMWGQWVPWAAITLAVTLPTALLVRERSTAGWWVAAFVTVVAAVAALVLVAVTGHSGATAVWGGGR
jgi:uncharacterized membrane protein